MASSALNKTVGDNYNTPCPHCGKINHDISQGVNVARNKFTTFTKQCFYCKKPIRYHARYEIKIEAYTNTPIE